MDLFNSPLFEPWTDPESGVVSYLLRQTVAPVQQSFYFTNRAFSADGRYLWFYTAHPPSGNAESGRTLGVADLREHTMRWFPETQFRDGSPAVDPVSGSVYWCWEYAVYRRGPAADAPVEEINALPETVHRNRYGKRLATHLTFSPDGRELLLDAHLGREWLVGSLPVNGTPFRLWQTFDRCYNHAQFSPTDPDLALIAQDWWIDVAGGERTLYDNRLWLLRRNGGCEPIYDRVATIAHEWWDPDGIHVWYVDYQRGTETVDIHTREKINAWPSGTCHSHASADGRYLVGDIGTYSWAKTGCRVAFFNRQTGREINLVSSLPLPPYPRKSYHLDPHPQFNLDDRVIVYTTTVQGRVTVAVVKTADLIRATGG